MKPILRDAGHNESGGGFHARCSIGYNRSERMRMLTDYIQAAMQKARYKILGGNEGFFGEIPGFKGLWANARTLEGCRDELRSVLESWLLIKLRHNDHDLPVVNGINLNPKRSRKTKVA
jgi:predicted RNase H-like HicB family nuclease